MRGAGAGWICKVFNLDEGPVTLIFPSALSSDSYEDLASHLELFLRKAKRRAAAEKAAKDQKLRENFRRLRDTWIRIANNDALAGDETRDQQRPTKK